MSPEVVHTVAEFRAACDRVRAEQRRLGLVLTMGALHQGHLQLVDSARTRADRVAVTLFVNPTQFGPNEDFQKYPRTLERDLALCKARGVELVFVPSVEEMYPPGERTRVQVLRLVDVLCGPKRPGHFDGVATVVTKFFAAAGPCVALFGRKDYQQLQVIRRLAVDLLLPVEVIGHPIVREADGLAMSSRNAYLSPEERGQAPLIARLLSQASIDFSAGERSAGALRQPLAAALEQGGFRLDYVELVTADDLVPIADSERLPERALLAIAVYLGHTRLIDNIVLGEDPPPILLAP
jgi:pantoate--beta-alanine ligase